MILPTLDRIHIRKLPEQERTIVLIQHGDGKCVDATGGDYRRNVVKAEVLAVGPGKWKETEDGERYFETIDVEVGQKIYCTEWNDLEGYLPKGEALIMEGDIIGFAN